MMLTQGIHGSPLVGGQISVYHRELSGVLCPGQAFSCFASPCQDPFFFFSYSILVALDIRRETKNWIVAALSDVM